MKTLQPIILLLLLGSNGILAQHSDFKGRINSFHKPEDFRNHNGISGKDARFEKLHPKNLKTERESRLKVNQFKAELAGVPKLDSLIDEIWDDLANEWIIYEKVLYSYSGNGNTVLLFDYLLDLTSGEWLNDYKGELIFDLNGNVTLESYYNWDESTAQWIGDVKYESAYDGNGNTTLWNTSVWDEETSQWVGYFRSESVFDEHNNTTLYSDYYFDQSTSVWAVHNQFKYENTYDESGNIISIFNDAWQVNSSQWLNSGKREYTYDDSGNNTYIAFYWDGNSQWLNQEKCEFTTESNGNHYSYIYYDWDENSGKWVESTKNEYTNDENGNIILSFGYDWDATTSQWVGVEKIEFDFDANGNMISYIGYEWDADNSEWIFLFRESYYYSEHVITLLPNISKNHLSVYPNPAREYVVFDLEKVTESATVELFGVDGKKVLEQNLAVNKQVSVSSLPKGLYMYKVNSSGNRYTGKLLVK